MSSDCAGRRAVHKLILLAILALVMQACSTNETQAEPPDDAPLRVLYAGDSLLAGYFTSQKASAFEERISGQLAPVVSLSPDLSSERLTTVGRVIAVPGDVQLAIVELGTNDAGSNTPLPIFEQQYDALLQNITIASPDAEIVCVGVWGHAPEYDEIISRACSDSGGRFVPLVGLYNDRTNRGPAGKETPFGVSDDFHPNDKGHTLIAGKILDVIPSRGR